jgi:hypothetical protein
MRAKTGNPRKLARIRSAPEIPDSLVLARISCPPGQRRGRRSHRLGPRRDARRRGLGQVVEAGLVDPVGPVGRSRSASRERRGHPLPDERDASGAHGEWCGRRTNDWASGSSRKRPGQRRLGGRRGRGREREWRSVWCPQCSSSCVRHVQAELGGAYTSPPSGSSDSCRRSRRRRRAAFELDGHARRALRARAHALS